MIDKVLCPYCGSEMKSEDWVKVDGGYLSYAVCSNDACQSIGPTVTGYETIAEARAAALSAAQARYLPPNRPLTLDEVNEHCKGGTSATPLWVEFDEGINRWVRIDSQKPGCELDYVTVFVSIMSSLYGKEWRCWIRKPTQEEMDAAGWGGDATDD